MGSLNPIGVESFDCTAEASANVTPPFLLARIASAMFIAPAVGETRISYSPSSFLTLASGSSPLRTADLTALRYPVSAMDCASTRYCSPFARISSGNAASSGLSFLNVRYFVAASQAGSVVSRLVWIVWSLVFRSGSSGVNNKAFAF